MDTEGWQLYLFFYFWQQHRNGNGRENFSYASVWPLILEKGSFFIFIDCFLRFQLNKAISLRRDNRSALFFCLKETIANRRTYWCKNCFQLTYIRIQMKNSGDGKQKRQALLLPQSVAMTECLGCVMVGGDGSGVTLSVITDSQSWRLRPKASKQTKTKKRTGVSKLPYTLPVKKACLAYSHTISPACYMASCSWERATETMWPTEPRIVLVLWNLSLEVVEQTRQEVCAHGNLWRCARVFLWNSRECRWV